MSASFCHNAKHFAFWNTKEGSKYLSILYINQLVELAQGEEINMNAVLNDRSVADDFGTSVFRIVEKRKLNHFISGEMLRVVLEPVKN